MTSCLRFIADSLNCLSDLGRRKKGAQWKFLAPQFPPDAWPTSACMLVDSSRWWHLVPVWLCPQPALRPFSCHTSSPAVFWAHWPFHASCLYSGCFLSRKSLSCYFSLPPHPYLSIDTTSRKSSQIPPTGVVSSGFSATVIFCPHPTCPAKFGAH